MLKVVLNRGATKRVGLRRGE